jgi:transcription elongation factor GreA
VRDAAFAPWLPRGTAGTLDLTASPAGPSREEFDVNASSAAVAADVLVTPTGYEQLCSELETLRTVRRPEITDLLRAAREDRDPDNPAVFDLLEGQAQLEERIALLETQLATARVVEPASDGIAGIGSLVRVRHEDDSDIAEYELVGLIESDVGNGRVSVGAPVGQALAGGRAGEVVAVETPRGTIQLEILSVRPATPSAAKTAA